MLKRLIALTLICIVIMPNAFAETTNLLTNRGFESGTFLGWSRSSTSYVTLNADTLNVYEGNYSAKIATVENHAFPFIGRSVLNIIPGAEYTFGAYVKALNEGCNIMYKFEFYSSNTASSEYGLGAIHSESSVNTATGNSFIYFASTVKVPKDCIHIYMYIRMYGTGECYIDNIFCRLTKEPNAINNLHSDNISFMYTTPSINAVIYLALYNISGGKRKLVTVV